MLDFQEIIISGVGVLHNPSLFLQILGPFLSNLYKGLMKLVVTISSITKKHHNTDIELRDLFFNDNAPYFDVFSSLFLVPEGALTLP